MKLAGGPHLSELNPDAFREQAHEYDAVPDLRDSVLKLLQLQGNTHPFAVVRFAELDRWAMHGDYERILGGDYPRRTTDRDASVGEEVRNAAKSYQDSWNRSEDPLAGILRGVAETAHPGKRQPVRPLRQRHHPRRQRTGTAAPGTAAPGTAAPAAPGTATTKLVLVAAANGANGLARVSRYPVRGSLGHRDG